MKKNMLALPVGSTIELPSSWRDIWYWTIWISKKPQTSAHLARLCDELTGKNVTQSVIIGQKIVNLVTNLAILII